MKLLPFLMLLAVAAAAETLSPEGISGLTLRMPAPGDYALIILSPKVLVLERITTKASPGAPVEAWDFVNERGEARLPDPAKIRVLVEGKPAEVQGLSFRRRPVYAPLAKRDLRIETALGVRLTEPLLPGQTVSVENPDGSLWPAMVVFAGAADPKRFSPAIHVNEEGYTLDLSKRAMVGAYLGSGGELEIGARTYTLVEATTGKAVFAGPLTPRLDKGWTYTPAPYQHVWEADFSAFNTPGRYRLQVEGLGASANFSLEAGLVMGQARAYALGLYHQRCGAANALPFTRHTHEACHTAPAEVPMPPGSFAKAWANIASANGDAKKNPRHSALRLESEATQLYPFIRTGKIDVSGGHHDAGDYSKYTINSALFIEALVIAADAFPGAGALDNLGLPESGDGRSDLLAEAKWEADFLAKMQDNDGGFYFLVYPRERKYESDVTPDHGDPQIVFPKTTSATASATAALAELASSPLFKKEFPAEAARYLKTAQRGWAFLKQALAAHGKDGSYQKLTHYGDAFGHDDELAWAACAIFAATGDEEAHTLLRAWYDPGSRETREWTWWRGFEGWGCAARLYALAARTGRLEAGRLDPAYLAKCTAEVIATGDDETARSKACAYGTSYPEDAKRFRNAGWYFSGDKAYEIAVAQVLSAKPENTEALIANLNYEAGCNPLNVSFLTGYGRRQQRDIVNQYAQNDRRVLPPTGIPLGNLNAGFGALAPYGRELGQLPFPGDGLKDAPYPLYDRWGDSFNTSNEAVGVNQARGLAAAAFLAARTPLARQPWRSLPAQLTVVDSVATLQATGLDFSTATVVWETSGGECGYDSATHRLPSGAAWVEAEARWPDGRRVFGQLNLPPRR